MFAKKRSYQGHLTSFASITTQCYEKFETLRMWTNQIIENKIIGKQDPMHATTKQH
jgi:hypothetical protein